MSYHNMELENGKKVLHTAPHTVKKKNTPKEKDVTSHFGSEFLDWENFHIFSCWDHK